MSNQIDVSELKGPLAELMIQFTGRNGRDRFEEFKLWLKRVELVSHLTTLTSVKVAGNVVINPHEFFNNREGLWTSDDFNRLILSGGAKKKVSAGVTIIGYADLAQAVRDAKIRSELPDGHVFEDVYMFLVHLATLIGGQWGGKEGQLLNNGYANIFYVKVGEEVLSVHAIWSRSARIRKWYVLTFHSDAGVVSVGSRVFSASVT